MAVSVSDAGDAADGATQAPRRTGAVSAFLQKLYSMVDDPNNASCVSWTSNGTQFRVHNVEDFARNMLPTYYRHNNFASFVRQLNMYCFRKVAAAHRTVVRHGDAHRWEFVHPLFRRGRPELMALMRRKTHPTGGRPTADAAHRVAAASAVAVAWKGSGEAASAAAAGTLDRMPDDRDREIASLRKRQTELEHLVHALRHQNTLIWVQMQQELARIREEYAALAHACAAPVSGIAPAAPLQAAQPPMAIEAAPAQRDEAAAYTYSFESLSPICAPGMLPETDLPADETAPLLDADVYLPFTTFETGDLSAMSPSEPLDVPMLTPPPGNCRAPALRPAAARASPLHIPA